MAAKGKSNPKPQPKQTQPVAAAKAAAAPLTRTFEPGFWQNYWLPSLIFIGISFALYFATIGFGYVLDDQMVIWENIYVQKGFGGLRDIFAYDSFMGYFKEQKFLLEGGRYRPLSLATFAIEVGIFGKGHPNIGHFINILLYGFNGILLFRVLLGLFPIQEGGKWFFSLPFIASLIFMLHPLHVEVVANIKGRDEILALMGSLGALYATLKYFDTENKGWLFASFFAMLLGALAKENAITFLAIIPLTLWFFTKLPTGRIVSSTMPLILGVLVFVFIRFKAMGYMVNHGQSMNDLMNNPFLGMTGGEKLATTFLTLGWYVKLLFVPTPLTHDYYPYHVPKVSWADWRAFGSLALYLVMGIYALLQTKKRTVPAYSIWFYLITLSIVSNLFVGIGTFMNERFLYMPSVGFAILIGWLLTRKAPELLNEPADRPYILGAGLVVVMAALFALRVWTRVPDWKDGYSLNKSAVINSPESCRSHCFYVTAIYQDQYLKEKDPTIRRALVDTMDYHIKKSLEINPNYTSSLSMVGAIATARFELDNQLDKLFNEFDYVLHKIPYHTNTRKFIGEYMRYLKNKGANPNKFATFCHRIGFDFYYREKKDVKSAMEYLTYGLEINTEDERILQDLVTIYTENGDKANAEVMQKRLDATK